MTSSSAENNRILVIQGPTASGKTDLALQLCEVVHGEIVNADSMQVYRGMDIGTAKPSREMRERVPHHLIDIVDPSENFSAADFRAQATAAIADIQNRGRTPVVVGGTGLYIRALVGGLVAAPAADAAYRHELSCIAIRGGSEALTSMLAAVDPVTAALLHPNDHLRIIRALEVYRQSGRPLSELRRSHGFLENSYSCLKLGIRVQRDELFRRIDQRVDQMLEAGLVDEVRRLLAAGYNAELKALRSIGYREICSFLADECSLADAVALIKRNTRRYAKRQETWFRKDREISWVEYPESFASIVDNVIAFFA